MDGQLQTPVVLIVFNRPTHTGRVCEVIARVKPQRLLIVADAPRPGKPGEDLLCDEARRIATRIDWPCQLDTNFAAHHMGCRDRVVSGLDWVFGLVEEAIILEDDILPDLSFFRFCEEMLVRYRQDSRVSMVAGFNIVQGDLHTNYSYFFSRLTHVWGWATWRRSWSGYDQHLRSWPEIKASGLLQEIFDRPGEVHFWTAIFDKMHNGTGPDTWDYQWGYTNFISNTVSVVPRVNLIENIGFGPSATHTGNARNTPDVKRQAIEFPLVHPPCVLPLRSMDRRDLELSGHITLTPSERFVRKWKRTITRVWNHPKQPLE
jgi:hypothetical protein